MAARSLGLAATLGFVANAFLLPPEISTDVIHDDGQLDPWMIVNPQSQPLLVPCLGCESEKTADKSLLLNISVGTEPGTLELGGLPFYPASAYMLADPESKPTVAVIPADVSMTDALTTLDQYSRVPVAVLNVIVHKPKTQSSNGEELIELDILLSGVDNQASEVPRVRVNILEEANKSLTILSTSTMAELPAVRPATGHEAKKPVCESALCQWRQFLEDKIESISSAAHKQFGHGRPCPGKMRHGGAFTSMHHGPGSHHHRPIGEAGRPHHHHGHPKLHHGHHRGGFHHFMHRVGRFVMAIAIPVLIGIAAGVLTYAIGMVVGMVIALVWIKVFRGGKRGYASVALTEDDAVAKEYEEAVESRESFESAPPLYEDAPAYEEKEVV